MNLRLLTMDVAYEHDVVLARQRARRLTAALKFDLQEQTRVATAVSEIARNAYQYAGGGKLDFQLSDDPPNTLLLTMRDAGPGIAELQNILDGKYVSQTGMGLGIIGAKRLMDYFDIQTSSAGTTVRLGKNLPPAFQRLSDHDLERFHEKVENQSPENVYEELQQQNKELLRTLKELRDRQSELVQLNRELDETNRGVVALYAELNDKADFLQRASEMKSHFLSNMSHEFRTPLNSIMGLTSILLDRMDGDLSAEQEKQVRYIRSSANDLIELINDLLDIAKVEAGKVTVRPVQFQVESLFGALRGMLRPLLLQNSSVSLVFEDPENVPELFTDDAKVSQILRNFISNALKFTERGEVRVTAKQRPDQTVMFSVADTGIGIAEEDQESVFLEWTQIEGKHQKAAKGTGLGLPLSRKLAQLLGGDVYLSSQLGLGSTFSLIIPTALAGETVVTFLPEMKRDVERLGTPVLVVEDNREALFLYDKYLKGTEFEMLPASDIRQARQILKTVRPVAILLDVLLHGEHSWDFLRELKEDNHSRDIPVFVVTVVDNRNKALSLGADAFHAKPLDRGWLLEQLHKIAPSGPERRILVVDDDDVSRYLLRSLLAHTACRVLEAKGGEDGFTMARQHRPDVILLDLGMPDLNGFDLLRKLKEYPETMQIPVIIRTAKVLDDDDRSRLSAAVDILAKETDSRETALAMLDRALAKAGVTAPSRETDAQAVT